MAPKSETIEDLVYLNEISVKLADEFALDVIDELFGVADGEIVPKRVADLWNAIDE